MWLRRIVLFTILLSSFPVMSEVAASINKGITLLEAFQIGNEEAKLWDPKANLKFITSVGDTGATPPSTLGDDGKREVWNILFTNHLHNKSMLINIIQGKIVIKRIVTDNVQDVEIIQQKDLVLDSPDMVKIAKQNGVEPGEGWAKGFHFTVVKDPKALFFGIIGQNKDGKMTKLYMDKTGKILGSVIKN
jgi:hypothetical protein